MSKNSEGKTDATIQAQAEADATAARGYLGTTPDPTPAENYTVAGVTSGKPTPETDEKLRAKAAAPWRFSE